MTEKNVEIVEKKELKFNLPTENKKLQKFIRESLAITEYAEKMQIKTDGDIKNKAIPFLSTNKEKIEFVDFLFEDVRVDLHGAWKNVLKKIKVIKEPFENATQIVKDKITEFTLLQQKEAEAEQQKLEEKARKEEEKRKKELAEQAKKWEEKGNIEKAEERRLQADMVIADTVKVTSIQTTIKSESGGGITRISDYDVTINNIKNALKYILEKKLYNTVEIKTGKIKSVFKALGVDKHSVPSGFRIIPKVIIKSQGGK